MELTSELGELMGVIIGDGNILYNYRQKFNRLTIAGDVLEDVEYFNELRDNIFQLTGKYPRLKIRKHKKGKGLELIFNNKQFISFLVEDLQLNYGDKTFIVKIPEKFTAWSTAKHILRGIFESDGSLYFSKSRVTTPHPTYPRIEIRTSSEGLAHQVFDILKANKFRIQIMKTKYGDFKIYLSGEKMLEKWIDEIGFSNYNTITKYLLWKKLGYYISRISLAEREKLI